jgi:hypothetical protein
MGNVDKQNKTNDIDLMNKQIKIECKIGRIMTSFRLNKNE